MTFSIRVRRLLLFLLTFTVFAGGAACGAQPDSAKVRQRVVEFGAGSTVRLRLADHSKVKGRIATIGEDSVDVVTAGGKTPVTVPFAQITAVSRKTSLGSRFKTGPCVDPITLAIASPFILVAALSGH